MTARAVRKITVLETPNSLRGPFTVVYNLAGWPEGSRRNRGWEKAHIVYEREATADEIAEMKESTRFLCYYNTGWAQVITDEARYGVDAEAAKAAWRARLRGEAA